MTSTRAWTERASITRSVIAKAPLPGRYKLVAPNGESVVGVLVIDKNQDPSRWWRVCGMAMFDSDLGGWTIGKRIVCPGDPAVAAPDLPPICATVEDVRRAAPVAGWYPVLPSFEWSFPRKPEWTVMRLEVVSDTPEWLPQRRWSAFEMLGWYGESSLFGARIGPRIVMPGEGE